MIATESALDETGKAIPANCLRVLDTPLPPERIGYCRAGGSECTGIQRDGSCLCDIVWAAREQGVDWQFEVNRDATGQDWWDYVGPPLAPFEPRLPPNVPLESLEPEPETFRFECPHCGAQAEHPLGFYWCGICGKNANDP